MLLRLESFRLVYTLRMDMMYSSCNLGLDQFPYLSRHVPARSLCCRTCQCEAFVQLLAAFFVLRRSRPYFRLERHQKKNSPTRNINIDVDACISRHSNIFEGHIDRITIAHIKHLSIYPDTSQVNHSFKPQASSTPNDEPSAKPHAPSSPVPPFHSPHPCLPQA